MTSNEQRPDIAVIPLRRAAILLGYTDDRRGRRAAEAALRRAGIKSGYPAERVAWLKDHRPGRGARTDKNRH